MCAVAHLLNKKPHLCQELMRFVREGTPKKESNAGAVIDLTEEANVSLQEEQVIAPENQKQVAPPKNRKRVPPKRGTLRNNSKTSSSTRTKVSKTGARRKISKYEKRRVAGALVRKRFDMGWFNGEIIKITENKVQVKFEDDDILYMSNDEAEVAIASYDMHVKKARHTLPGPGTRVRAHFDQGWFDGSYVSADSNKKAYILFDDGGKMSAFSKSRANLLIILTPLCTFSFQDDGYMSESEAVTAAMAYSIHHGRL